MLGTPALGTDTVAQARDCARVSVTCKSLKYVSSSKVPLHLGWEICHSFAQVTHPACLSLSSLTLGCDLSYRACRAVTLQKDLNISPWSVLSMKGNFYYWINSPEQPDQVWRCEWSLCSKKELRIRSLGRMPRSRHVHTFLVKKSSSTGMWKIYSWVTVWPLFWTREAVCHQWHWRLW